MRDVVVECGGGAGQKRAVAGQQGREPGLVRECSQPVQRGKVVGQGPSSPDGSAKTRNAAIERLGPGGTAGKATVNVAPCPGLESTVILPSWREMMPRRGFCPREMTWSPVRKTARTTPASTFTGRASRMTDPVDPVVDSAQLVGAG